MEVDAPHLELFSFVSPSPIDSQNQSSPGPEYQNNQQNLSSNNQKILLDLYQILQVPIQVTASSNSDIISWCISKLISIQEVKFGEEIVLDSETLCKILSPPQAPQIIQLIIKIVSQHLNNNLNSENGYLDMLNLLSRIEWANFDNFLVCGVVFALISISMPICAIPCILRFSNHSKIMVTAIKYINKYFSTLVCSSYSRYLSEFLESPNLQVLQNLVAFLRCPELLHDILKYLLIENGSKNNNNQSSINISSQKAGILNFSAIESLFTKIGNQTAYLEIFTEIQGLILDNLDLLNDSIGYLILLLVEGSQSALFCDQSNKILNQFFDHFYDRVLLHISGEPTSIRYLIRNIVMFDEIKQKLPKNQFDLLLSYDAICCHFQGSQLSTISEENQSFKIEKLKRISPTLDLNWNQINSILSSNFSMTGQSDQQPQEPEQKYSINQWTFDEISNLLENIIFNLKNGFSESIQISKRLPVDWLISLIDRGSFKIMFLSVNILQMVCEAAQPLKLYNMLLSLIEYFEVLCVANALQTVQNDHNNHSDMHTIEPKMFSGTEILDAKPTIGDKIQALKPLFLISRKHKHILHSVITHVLKKLCSPEKLLDLQGATIPSFSYLPDSSNHYEIQLNGNNETDKSLLQETRKRSRIENEAFLEKSTSKKLYLPANASTPSSSSQQDYYHRSKSMESIYESTVVQTPTDRMKVIPTPVNHASYELLRLLDVLMDGRKYPDHMVPFLDTFLAVVDSKYPSATFESYSDVLPKKTSLDRDLYLEQLFLKRPILMNMLELISQVPVQFKRCFEIVKSLLAVTIGNWHAETCSDPKQSYWYNFTMILISILDKVEWLPPVLSNVHDIFEFCTPNEISLILLSIWNFMKDYPIEYNPPVLREDGTVISKRKWTEQGLAAQWPLEMVRFVLRRNINKLTTKALHMYMRTKI